MLDKSKIENVEIKTNKINVSDNSMNNSVEKEIKKLDIILEEGWRWRLLKVKSGSEFIVQEKLEREHSDSIAAIFIPFTISPIKRGIKIVQHKKIIHPGYIYGLCKKEGYHEALRMVYKQLEILLYVASDKRVDLQQIKNMCNITKDRIDNSLFKEGDSVQILSGIWKDFSGIVMSVNNTTVKVQINNFSKTFADCNITDIKTNKEEL